MSAKQNPNVKPDTGGHIAVSHLECDDDNCNFCVGALFACILCGSAEGGTTTECPKVTMTADQADAVYAGKLDYRAGEWREEASRYSPGGIQGYLDAVTKGTAREQKFPGVAWTADMMGVCPPDEMDYFHAVPCRCGKA